MDKYMVLDSTEVKKKLNVLPLNFEDNRLVVFDDKLWVVYYYVHKNKIERYKKRIK